MTGQGKSAIDTLLAESFKELALKQPIEKITIKEITDKAGVIRPTFYNHFQDKYDLLEWIIDKELLEPVEPLIQNGMINEALVLLFGGIDRSSRARKGVRTAGLYLADDNGPVRFLYHHIQLPHPGVEVVCQQPAALLLIPAGRSSFSPVPRLSADHIPFSGQ